MNKTNPKADGNAPSPNQSKASPKTAKSTMANTVPISDTLLADIERIQDMPSRLIDAFAAQANLVAQGVYFAPVRHHSPACAYALKSWIAHLRPTHILIEAPTAFMSLLPDLLSADTVPPVAIFAQATYQTNTANKSNAKADNVPFAIDHDSDSNNGGDNDNDQTNDSTPPAVRSAYFPFCDYSPEWVAIQDGAALGADVRFIDLDWASQCQLAHDQHSHDSATVQAQTNLMAERYLAHSRFIQALADACHCRHHDELWSHLFELAPPEKLADPPRFFADVLAWCALARLDYEDDVLLADGSLHREYCMYSEIAKVLSGAHGNVLIITGGFHTLALIEALTSPKPKKYQLTKKDIHHHQDAWLIRYSYDRLDALAGYASGMPSPAYYQWWWQSLLADSGTPTEQALSSPIHDADARYIQALCHTLHARDCYEMTPFIAYQSVMQMVLGLAALRGHHRPGRDDLLDGLQTALIKGERDDGRHHLWRCVHEYLSGDRLGQVAKGTRTPALVANVYNTASALKFKLDDTALKVRKLDIYRSLRHRQVSQFLHVLDFLDVGFASRVNGPDFVLGVGMSLLFEEWRYAWTPSVEARLIALSEQGDRLQTLALVRLMQLQTDAQISGQGAGAEKSAELLATACRLGLTSELPRLQAMLDDALHHDSQLTSVLGATERLFYLWHGRTLLTLPENALTHSITLGVRGCLYLCDQLYDDHEDARERCAELFKQLYHLLRHIQDKLGMDGLVNRLYERLDRAYIVTLGLYQLAGALDAACFLDGRISTQDFDAAIAKIFGVGAIADDAVAYVQGMFRIAPEVFVQSATAISALHQQIDGWDDGYFLQVLPDLRFIFSQLTPKQSDHVADTVAGLTGLTADDIRQVALDITEADMLQASGINQRIDALLTDDGLMDWLRVG